MSIPKLIMLILSNFMLISNLASSLDCLAIKRIGIDKWPDSSYLLASLPIIRGLGSRILTDLIGYKMIHNDLKYIEIYWKSYNVLQITVNNLK